MRLRDDSTVPLVVAEVVEMYEEVEAVAKPVVKEDVEVRAVDVKTTVPPLLPLTSMMKPPSRPCLESLRISRTCFGFLDQKNQ